MLKFNYIVNLGVASVLVVPAVSLQSGAAGSLEESLQRTLVALERLTGFEQRLQSGDATVTEEILRWTESPIGSNAPGTDPGENDRTLESLRSEVSNLEMNLDVERRQQEAGTMATQPSDSTARPGRVAHPVVLPTGATGTAPKGATTGLDDATRRRLAQRSLITETRHASSPSSAEGDPGDAHAADGASGSTGARAKIAFEKPGYTADPVLLGRAYYRKGQFEQALATLNPVRAEAEGRYWIARCLEKLGRHDEALTAFGEVLEMEAAEHLIERAREDADFLRWRLKFEKRKSR